MSAEAIARAAGILGGEGIDTIRNEGTLTVEADAIAGAGSIAVGISSGDEGGPAKAKTDASGKATTHSTGISGGSGDDTIVNIAPVNVTATSTVGAGSVSVGVGMGVDGKRVGRIDGPGSRDPRRRRERYNPERRDPDG